MYTGLCETASAGMPPMYSSSLIRVATFLFHKTETGSPEQNLRKPGQSQFFGTYSNPNLNASTYVQLLLHRPLL